MDQNEMLSRITSASRRDIIQLLKFLNFEIEYILRPRSAPAKGAPRLMTDRRAQSARRVPCGGRPQRNFAYSTPAGGAGGGGYWSTSGNRSQSSDGNAHNSPQDDVNYNRFVFFLHKSVLFLFENIHSVCALA